MLLINIIVFIGAFILLVKGAELFVTSSSWIAKRFGVSEFIIGLTLVSVGTSVPELASSLTASFQHASGLIIGNVLGSNIANIGLIVSTSALLSNVKTEELMLRRDGYVMLFSSFLFFFFILDYRISRVEALIFLFFYIAYLLFLIDEVKKHNKDIYFKEFLRYFLRFEYIFYMKSRVKTVLKKKEAKEFRFKTQVISKNKEANPRSDIDPDHKAEDFPRSSLLIEFSKLIASGFAITIGANFFVEEAIFFASLLRVPETLIGFSLVAVGTSVPELMVTVSAARSGYSSIALGNVIGSNTTNLLLILGCSGLVSPLTITELSVYYIAPFMLIISALFLLFIRTGWRIKRFEGLILFLLYSGFMIFIFQLY